MKHVIASVIGLSLLAGCSATFSLGDSSARSNARPADTHSTETATTETQPTEESNAPATTAEPKSEQPTEQAGAGGLDPQ